MMKPLPRVVTLLALLLCAVGPASAGQATPGRASGPRRETQAPPPGWNGTLKKTMDLELAGKVAEIVPIYEKWVADFPNFADAHVMLAGAHENLGRRR